MIIMQRPLFLQHHGPAQPRPAQGPETFNNLERFSPITRPAMRSSATCTARYSAMS